MHTRTIGDTCFIDLDAASPHLDMSGPPPGRCVFTGRGWTTPMLDKDGRPKTERWGLLWRVPYFEFQIDLMCPLTFWDDDGTAYQPDRHVLPTDGGSIPPPLWAIPGLSPQRLPRAYPFHDCAFRYGGLYARDRARPFDGFHFRRMGRRECNELLGRMAPADGAGPALTMAILAGLTIGSRWAWHPDKQAANRKAAGID
jgi:hypothetical protein